MVNETNFKNRVVSDFSQAQIDAGFYIKGGRFQGGIGFHWLPYAKPQITDGAKTIWIYQGLSKGTKRYSLWVGSTSFRQGLTVTQLSPRVVWNLKGNFSLSLRGDFHYYNKKGVVHLPARWLASVEFALSLKGNKYFNPSISLYVGRRVFSYRGGLIENHPQEHRKGLSLRLGGKLQKDIAWGVTLFYKRYRELAFNKKAQVVGVVFGLSFGRF